LHVPYQPVFVTSGACCGPQNIDDDNPEEVDHSDEPRRGKMKTGSVKMTRGRRAQAFYT
jgi:hypothetical protein